MKTNSVTSISKLSFLLLLIIGANSLLSPFNKNLLAETALENQFQGPSQSKSIKSDEKEPECDGVWMYSEKTGKIFLNSINLADWGKDTNPSLILDTYVKVKNFLIIGHNICQNGLCDIARSQFSNIMKLNLGDKVSVCIAEVLYTGYIFTSGPIEDTRVSVMGDWTGFNTVTMFTSYGECKDVRCSSTKQRWMVAFERDK